ncbi:MAG: hypothetical protein WCI65_12180 [Synechococcaceae cyanobacterium ELA263]
MTAAPINPCPFDPEPARLALTLLGKDPARIRLRFFAHKLNPRKKEIGARKGCSLSAAAIEAQHRQERGAYFVVNNGGDTAASITSCVALFVEWDDMPIEWQRTAWRTLSLPEPSLQIETGGASIHSYWILQKRIKPNEWVRLQNRLIKHCNSDAVIKDASRVMRLPGAWYIGADGQPVAQSRLTHASDRRYSVKEVMANVGGAEKEPAATGPEPNRAREPERSGPRNYPPRTLEQVMDALRCYPVIAPKTGQRSKYMTMVWGLREAVREAGGTDELALQLIEAHSPGVVDATEYLKTEPHTIGSSKFFNDAYKFHGWRTAGARPAAARRLVVEDDDDGEDLGKDAPPEAQPEPEPYQVLGWCTERRKVWYRHRQTAQIASALPYGQAELLKLAPLQHWWDAYPVKNDDGEVIRCNWARAASELIEAANRSGVFEIEQVRGRGVWLDDGRVVWHLGDQLEVDGQKMALTDLQSRSQYGLMPALPIDLEVDPLGDDHGRQILQVLKDRGWQGPSDHLHLAGWIVLSSVGGALRKRPGLQITSPFGSGKSDTIERVIDPLQGGIGRSTTGSTEAGIRQLIGRDALPCTVDESEAEDGRKREAQLRLVRFSYDGIPQVKGTPGGGPMTFCLRSALALAGINSPIDNPADRSRMAVISPRHLPADQWNEVSRRRDSLITVEIGQRLLRRTVSSLPALLANITTFGHLVGGQIASNEAGRAGDTFGALLAGAHHLTSTAELTKDEAQTWLDSIGWEIGHADTDDSDRKAGAEGRQCLEHLLGHEVRWNDPGDRESGRPTTGSLTVRELVALAHLSPRSIDGQEARTALGRKGIHATPEGLAVAGCSSPGTIAIFSPTKWMKGGHRSRLLEIEGTTRTNGTVRFPHGGSHRAVIVPWDAVGALGEE